jgi:hypothetical protein
MRPSSLSRNPARVLRDAITTLRRIHAPDRRVPAAASAPTLCDGADPALLPARVVHFAAYAAGLALGAGEAGPALELLQLETLQPFLTEARVDAKVVAQNLLYAASFARCESPAAVAQAWPEIAPAADLFLTWFGRRLDEGRDFGRRTMEMIEQLIAEACQRPAMHRAEPVGAGAA